jgi:hypothetical protein
MNRAGCWRRHEDDQIKQLWQVRPPVSNTAIAGQLPGRTASAVVNRANRLGLTYRGEGGGTGTIPYAATADILEHAIPVGDDALHDTEHGTVPLETTALPSEQAENTFGRGTILDTPSPPKHTCCWPMWDHNTKPTHDFCGKRRQKGRVYCPTHAKLAHVRIHPLHPA